MNNFKFKVGDKVNVSDSVYLSVGGVSKVDKEDSWRTYFVVGEGRRDWVREDQLSLIKEDKLVMPKWFDDWYNTFDDDSVALHFATRPGWGLEGYY